jgi:hypothetical protein
MGYFLEEMLKHGSQGCGGGLSERAMRFVRAHKAAQAERAQELWPRSTGPSRGGARVPEEILARATRFRNEYGGLTCVVPGGVLVGELRFALRDPAGLVQRTPDGTYMFVAVEHSTAQCALTISDTGAFGSSWSGEFGELFDSVEHLIESLALWELFTGWSYVSLFPGHPGEVPDVIGGLALDEASAGSTSQWWIGPNAAVVREPYLTPTTHDRSQVTVLARSSSEAKRLSDQLAGTPLVSDGFTAARVRSVVGRPV